MPAGAEAAPKHYENVDSFREHWNALGVRNMTDIRAKGTPYEHIRPSEIEVDKASRNKGLGTAFMEDLVAFADLTGKQIRINPSDELGATSKGRLEKFYKRFGFVENKPGKNKDYAISERFYRQPSSGERFMPASDDIRFMPDYSGEHRAPQRDYGAPLDNLKGVYPDDVYGPTGALYYGHASGDATDKAAIRIIQSARNKPDAPVKVFRAIPKSIQSNEINPGDWITTIKSYAVQHGEGPLGGDYKILEKTVPAGDLYTNGDSIFEFGYDPKFMPETIQRDVGRNQDFANPPTDAEAVDALSSEKKAKFGAARNIKPGTQVAARIDIPAFLRTGKYVVAVHEPDGAAGGPGKVIGYDTVTRLQNPKFVVKPGVQRIYEGKSAKFPVATVDGKIMADRSIPGDLENYVPVGMDPKEHAYFYDKRTDQPVIGGSESVSVGNTVFVKNPVYGDPSQFAFMPSPDSAMPGAYSFPGGYRALPGKAKGSLRLYGPAGSLIGIAASLDEAQRIIRKKSKQ